MAAAPPTLGLILAGGRSRRMGGVDKAFLPLAARPLLAHVVDRAGPQCAGLILSANDDPDRFAAYGLPVVADPIPGFQGPLAGILAGLDWLDRHRPDLDWLATFPVDTPLVPNDLVARLHAARHTAGTPIACAESGGRLHPVCGLWSKALGPELRRQLSHAAERRVEGWAAARGLATAAFPAIPYDPFTNVNRAEDLAALEALVRV